MKPDRISPWRFWGPFRSRFTRKLALVFGLVIGLFLVGCGPSASAPPTQTFRLSTAAFERAPATVRQEYERRLELFERRPADLENLAALATFFQANGFAESAIPAYDELRRRAPRNPLWSYRLALIHGQRGETEAALRELTVTTTLQPDNALAWWRTGALLSPRAEKTMALAAFQKALSLDPQLAHAHIGLARLHLAAGEAEAARAELLLAIKIDPNLSLSYNLLAQVYRSLGQEDAAREVERLPASRYRAYEPVDPAVDVLRGACVDVAQLRVAADAEFTSLHSPRAIPLLQQALRLEPDNAGVALALAKVYLADEQTELAFPWLEKAIAQEPHLTEAHYVLAYERRRLKQGPDALAALNRGIDSNPTDASLRHLRGLCHLDSGEVDAAGADFAGAIAMSPQNLTYLLALADLRWANGLQDDAAVLYERAATAAPLAIRPRLALAQYHLERGELEEGHSWIVGAALADPSSPEPDRMKAKYFLQLGMKHLEENRMTDAVAAFQAALLARPDYLPAMENLCLAYLRQDRLGEATSVLERFISANSEMAKPHYLLAVLLHKQGRVQEARDHLISGTDLARDSGDAATLDKIQNLQKLLGVTP